MSAKVTTVLCAYNDADFLAGAIESVVKQTEPDWRLIVVDDGSTDATPEIVRPFLADDRIRYVRKPNGGLASARNVGLAAATTPYVSLLDADDRYRPDYTARMCARLDADPGLSFVCCDAVTYGAPALAGRRVSDVVPLGRPITLQRLLDRSTKIFGLTTFRRARAVEVGGFDSSLRAVEDYDLWLRLVAAGGGAAYVDAPLVDYCVRPGSLSANLQLMSASELHALTKLRAARPDLRPECSGRMRQIRLAQAVHRMKAALREGDARAFLRHGRRAVRLGAGPKVAAALAVGRLSPGLLRQVAAARDSI